ncbi:MAG: hypothetical protein IH972_03395, partial [Candidatus Marinimicrobia bacterium]|nr:hypothetical protein [Candidatus Neomarinimicrobiota bacterium]
GVDIGYSRIEVNHDEVEQFLSQQGSGPGWIGWSVTMPLKAAMVTHMTSISPRVQTLGAAPRTVAASSAAQPPVASSRS